MEISKKARNPELDALKGLAILLVIIGHAIQFNISNFKVNPFFNFIYSFHMPLFMFISGYIAYITIRVKNYKDSISIITKKFKNLVIPFLSWYLIVNYLVRKVYLKESISDFFLKLFRDPGYGLWFFWVLFLCFFVLIIILTIQLHLFRIKHLIVDVAFWYFISFAIMVLPISISGIQMLKWYFPFFITGYLISKYKNVFARYQNIVGQLLLVIFPILLSQYSFMNDLGFIKYLAKFNGIEILAIDKIYRYLIAFAGITVMFFIVKGINKLKIFEFLVWLGKYTMEIYAIHFYFVKIVGKHYVSGELGISIFIVLSAIVITLSTSLSISILFIRKSKILSLLLLGK